MSVPGVGTAHPSACADQPSRPSTACQSTRRGRPRRCWRARRRLSRAAPSSPSLRRAGAAHLAPTIQLRRFGHEDSRRGARVTTSPRVASPMGTRRTWPARPRKRALTFEASGELPALAVRRMLRQHGCADSVEHGRAGRHGLRRAAAAVQACAFSAACRRQVRAERALRPSLPRGRERGLAARRIGWALVRQRTCMPSRMWMRISPSAREGWGDG